MSALSRPFLIGSFTNLQVTLTYIRALHEFKIWPDPTTDYGVSCPLASEKNYYDNNGEYGASAFS